MKFFKNLLEKVVEPGDVVSMKCSEGYEGITPKLLALDTDEEIVCALEGRLPDGAPFISMYVWPGMDNMSLDIGHHIDLKELLEDVLGQKGSKKWLEQHKETKEMLASALYLDLQDTLEQNKENDKFTSQRIQRLSKSFKEFVVLRVLLSFLHHTKYNMGVLRNQQMQITCMKCVSVRAPTDQPSLVGIKEFKAALGTVFSRIALATLLGGIEFVGDSDQYVGIEYKKEANEKVNVEIKWNPYTKTSNVSKSQSGTLPPEIKFD